MNPTDLFISRLPDDLPGIAVENARLALDELLSEPYPILSADRENQWWEHFKACVSRLRWPDDYWTPIHFAYAIRTCVQYADDMTQSV